MKQKIQLVLVILCLLNLLTGCSTQKVPESVDYSANGNLHCGYFYQDDKLSLATSKHFMESDSWNPVVFDYICQDISCNHKGAKCKASFIASTDIFRDDVERTGENIFSFDYNGKRIIVDTYLDECIIEQHEMMQECKMLYKTDIYKANQDGSNRKLILSFDGGIDSNVGAHSAVLYNGKLYFGGKMNMAAMAKQNEETKMIESLEVCIDHAFYEIDMSTYKVKTIGKENCPLDGGYACQVFQEGDWIYFIRYSTLNQKADWYVTNNVTGESRKIISFESETPYIKGIIDDCIIANKGNVLYRYDWLEKDTMDVIYTSEDENPVVCVLEDEIWVATDKSFDKGNDYIEYMILDKEGNKVGTNSYSEYITFLEVMGERVVYVKPLTEDIEEWWCDWDKVSTLEGSTYIGTCFGIDME